MHSSSFRSHVAFSRPRWTMLWINWCYFHSSLTSLSAGPRTCISLPILDIITCLETTQNKINIDLAGLSPTYLTFSTLKLKKLPTKNLASLRAKQMMAPRSSCSLKMQTRTQKGKIPMTLSQKRFGTRNDTGHVSCISMQEFAPFWRAGGRAWVVSIHSYVCVCDGIDPSWTYTIYMNIPRLQLIAKCLILDMALGPSIL